MRIHLVDGTFEMFRCFHGAPRVQGPDGREVGAVRGLLATLTALLAEPGVSHVAIAFDSVIAAPKADRGTTADALISSQLPLAADVVRALNLPLWPAGRFQADELLATGAARFAGAPGVDQVVLCTTDLDLAQCVRGERVVVLDRIRRRVTDEAAVRARFGVAPQQLPDLFALVGDTSDGLPGVPGWGLRSAGALIAAHGRLEAVPDDPAQWQAAVRGAARLADSLRRHRREALLAKALLTLRDDVPLLEHDADDLRWPGADRAAVQAVAARLGDASVVDRVPGWSDG